MRRVLVAAVALVVLLSMPSVAQATSSTVVKNGAGNYELVDKTPATADTDNSYGVYTDPASGQWVIFDFNGDVTTGDASCIGKTLGGRSALFCPRVPSLNVKAGAGSDLLQVAVADTADVDPFGGKVVAHGGSDDDILHGGNGDDELYGDDGNDLLDGGAGADRMVGGPGAQDECCYAGRQQGVTINLNGIADDGGAVDGNADLVDSSNEVLVGGDGNDTLDSSGATIEAGIDCVDDPRYDLRGGPGDDRMAGSSCLGDYFDGGDGADQVSYPNRASAVSILQDGLANDGRSSERDNVRASVEQVVGTEYDDLIAGADRFTDPKQTRATLIGAGGSDLIAPGRRTETVWADGLTLDPGANDQLFYGARDEPVNVSLNDIADDGQSQPAGNEEHDDIRTENVDNVKYGFDDIWLGNNDDTYWGAYADNVPNIGLKAAVGGQKQITVRGEGGADKFYSGTNAETISGGDGVGTSWSNSDRDLASYLYRKPRDWGLARVSLSLDGKANDGETLDGVGSNLLIGSLVAPVIGMARIYKFPNVAAIEQIEAVNTSEAWIKLKFPDRIPRNVMLRGWEAVQYLIYVADFLRGKFGEQDPVARDVARWRNEMIDTMQAPKPPPPSAAAALLVPATFLVGGYVGERDNLGDDIEALQGSSNTGLTVVPLDYIVGNDKANTVIGSPGPDMVDGRGGNDVIEGDISADPFYNQDADQLFGGSGTDFIFGGAGPDYVVGGTGRDALFANDSLFASDGWRDVVNCGDADFSFPGTKLSDRGPYEQDAFLADESRDGDLVPDLCKPTITNPSSVGREGTTLVVASSPGRKSKLRLSTSGSQVLISDSAGRFDVGNTSGCIVNGASPNQASCSSSGVSDIRIDTSNLKDTVDLSALSGSFTTHVTTGDGNDKITGSSGNDTIDAGPGKDRVKARGGDDVIDGGTGRDLMDGGEGSDTIDYSKRGAAVDVYLAQPSTKGNGETTQTLSNFDQSLRVQRSLENDTIKWAESVKGGTGNDILQGNQLNNTIDAGKGDDALSGGDGDDQLLPGIGSDNILAGNGNDYIPAKDGYADLKIDCGGGTDSGSKDAGPGIFDPATIGCEF